MKKVLLTLMIYLSAIMVYSQASNLILFTEQGEQFWVILNGIRQNAKPETNVKITDLTAPSYKVKIIFKDSLLKQLDKTIFFQEKSSEATYVIKKNNKNEYTIRFMNSVPISQVPPAPVQNQTQIGYTETPPPVVNDKVYVGITVKDETTGTNFNMNISQNENQQTVSYSNTTETYSSQYYHPSQGQTQYVYQMPGYKGSIGCPYPMPPDQFGQVKQSIAGKSFDDSKLTIAKQVISNNCLLSSQVKDMLKLFSFEDTRLELAKYAYGFTYDIANYYQINDAFTFESSIQDLNKYIADHPVQPLVIQIAPPPPPKVVEHQTSRKGCPKPLSQKDFIILKQKVNSKSQESAKVAIAKQYIKMSCLLTNQVRELLMLLSMEHNKLDLAKLAFDYTYDMENYYSLSDVFEQGYIIDDFNNFIQSHHIVIKEPDHQPPHQHQHEHQKPPHTNQNLYVLPGYNGPIGCPYPISQQEFAQIKESVKSKSFEDSKLTIAKQVLNSNCLLTSQVKELMMLFTYEDSRLDFAKAAYGHTFDIGNYYQLNDAFEYESSIDELNTFINGNKK